MSGPALLAPRIVNIADLSRFRKVHHAAFPIGYGDFTSTYRPQAPQRMAK
jgi:hypothetical protein